MKIAYTIALLIFFQTSYAQDSYPKPDDIIPEVGKPMLDFTFYNIEHPKKSKVTLADYKGKWLFLDFWYRGCKTCLTSLSKVNDLQQHFKSKIHFLMVGVNGEMMFGNGIRPLYERLRERSNLQLTVTYDSIWNTRWNIYSFPHIVIVDPNGIVRAITTGEDMTVEKINDLLSNEEVSFLPKDVERPSFDPVLTSLSNDSLLYRSQLSHWSGERQSIPPVMGSSEGKAGIRICCIPLQELYTLAFTGKNQWFPNDSLYLRVYAHPLWEVSDKSISLFDYKTGKGIYNYDLIMPGPKSKQEIMNAMQQELYNTFGFEASLEERWMPVWKLVALKGTAEKLKTKGGMPGFNFETEANGDAAGFGFQNYPMSILFSALTYYAPHTGVDYIDETNIHHNIDIEMNVMMLDQEAVKKELRRNGLDLVLGNRLMKVIVIRDKKLNN